MKKMVALVFALVCFYFVSVAEEPAVKNVPVPYRVAVLEFKNQSGNDKLNPYVHTISRIMMDDLTKVNGLMVVERNQVADVIKEIELGKDGMLEEGSYPKAQKALSADFILEGFIKQDGENLTIGYSLYSFAENKKIVCDPVTGAPDDLLNLASQIKEGVVKAIQPKNINIQKGELPKMIKMGVIPFEDLSPEGRLASLAEFARFSLEGNLSTSVRLCLLDRARLNEIVNEQKISMTAIMDENNALKIGKIAGVNFLALGSVIYINQQLRVDTRVISVESGQMLFNVTATGAPDEIPALTAKISDEILKRFNLVGGGLPVMPRPVETVAAKEAMFHLREALKSARESRMVITPDEQKALQRAMYLDALDTSAEMFLIDQLIDSEMFQDAERHIRQMLKRKIPETMKPQLWRRLADVYEPRSALPIHLHIIKNFPESSEALEARWRILFGRGNAPFYAQDLSFSLEAADTLAKNIDRFQEYAPRLITILHGPNRLFRENEIPAQHLQYVKTRVAVIDKDKIDADKIYQDIISTEKPPQAPTRVNVDEYVNAFKAGKIADAYKLLVNFVKNCPECPALFKELERISVQYEFNRDYDNAIDVTQNIVQMLKNMNEKSKVSIYEFLFRNESRIKSLKESSAIWKNCNLDNYKIPEFPADRTRRRPDELQYMSMGSGFYGELVRKYPDNPAKAYEAMQEKNRDKPKSLQGSVSVLIAEYALANNMTSAMKLFNEYVSGNSIEDKIKNLHPATARIIAEYYTQRMEYQKAVQIFDIIDPMVSLDIQIYKLNDCSSLEKQLWTGGGVRTVVPPFMKYGPRVGGQNDTSVKRQRLGKGYIVFLTGIYWEKKGDLARAHDLFYEYINGPAGWIPFHDEAIHANAREHLAAIDKILIPETEKTFTWKVGDYWEGVQCWYLSSPENKKIEEGWVFTPLYFEVVKMRSDDGLKQFVLNIYNGTREEIKKDAAAQNKLFLTTFIDAATLSTNVTTFGPVSQALKGNNCMIPTPHVNLIVSSGHAYLPIAENSLALDAAVLLAKPFRSAMSAPFKDNIKYSEDNLSVEKQPLKCQKTELTMPLDWMMITYANEVNFQFERAKKYEQKAKGDPYVLEEWWNDKYPWWLRTAEKNRWYAEGVSPQSAKYSKLFVCTSINGKEINVDTGLPGELSDIKVLREKYKDYAKNTEFNKYPHRQFAEFLDLFDEIYTPGHSPNDEVLLKNKDIVKNYFLDVVGTLQKSDPGKARKVMSILLDKIQDESLWSDMEKTLSESPADKSRERVEIMMKISTSRSPKAFDLLSAHLTRCQEKKYPHDEIDGLYKCFARMNDYRIVPLMLELYKKNKTPEYLDNALRVQRQDHAIYPGEWKPLITDKTDNETIERTIKNLSEWYEYKKKAPKVGTVGDQPRRLPFGRPGGGPGPMLPPFPGPR